MQVVKRARWGQCNAIVSDEGGVLRLCLTPTVVAITGWTKLCRHHARRLKVTGRLTVFHNGQVRTAKDKKA